MNKFKMFKKCLLGLFLGLFGFIGFSDAGTLVFTGHVDYTNINKRGLVLLPHYSADNYTSTLTCNLTNLSSSQTWSLCYSVSYAGNTLVWGSKNDNCWSVLTTDTTLTTTWTIYPDIIGVILRNNTDGTSMSFDYECTYEGEGINLKCPACQECQECVTCDAEYCEENNLCSSSNASWSELKINNIVHEGKPLINIFIPDYIHWDYTVDENQYDVYVGSGYDQEYIDSVLKINSYRPDNEDFTNIFVSGLTLIFPYIFVALLIVFMWKLLKRIFK